MSPKPSNVYVFGHQNPDTDSICSALAYTAYKKATGHPEVLACRLGPVNKETKYALDYFNVEPPKLIRSVKPQVSDLHFNNFSMVTEQDSVLTTMNQIIANPGRSLPVVDTTKKLTGIISLPDIIQAYTDTFRAGALKESKTPFANLIDILDARTIGRPSSPYVEGNVYANTQLLTTQTLEPADMIVTSINDTSLDKAYNSGAGILILCDAPIGKTPDIPEVYKGMLVLSEDSPFEVYRRLSQVIPIANFVQHQNLEYFLTYETLEDVKNNMLSSEHARFPVVDEDGKVLASISKSSLLDFNRKKVILVDHNEKSQSIMGIDEAEIVEVVDHHRIAEITTAAPLYMRIEPVGCTSTIIARMFLEKKLPIPRPIAGVMLSAILSDTLIFNSPTCTDLDREVAAHLAEITGVDVHKYGRDMLIAGSNLSDMTPEQIISADRKFFTMGQYRVMISQINTGDYKGIFSQLKSILSQMEADCDKEGFDLAILMVSDVLLGGSELLVTGKARNLVRLAFGIEDDDVSQFFPGMFSRKKQVVPPLMNAASL